MPSLTCPARPAGVPVSPRLRRVLLAAPVVLVTLVATASAVCLATTPSAWSQAPMPSVSTASLDA